ncbi:putative HAD-superfamily hydrolase, subfamily IG, 5'-nucleotidase, HAD-like superfamily [Helianthus annuus]|uniref:HAD-superfamily hydrolase, subfamily IG, 5'-nucleotidase, HAD-like superfamily n=1 Tax=Helianthus annuus TaxID=4232 RepID=A0A9K3J5K8_HELAN|nr:putative HAD-superfamily hydrolase, subfamily IG, 5'-nucleotidase, HAD-like superfamily [Helianthus annuus]KAJ0580245.1 putative HAD-superfamily hydrolase, subfamily IG, 5'-nucleotidase, HAD-like superfamily [Helianthus annuus]KAJ0596191.1 putative HAD-superfamily hydrolase, subfamily IG, 5'-nucleotidase, HAD-like superfamily [Helianthus annuus]KAJ0756845.1 putative HAD-superfamily hydrolase, subfamily IG, 5'-nucleotidase, HAD-like superfamily [Helianthus annuus]KAJ0760582.1 putative HAD-sup
MNCGALSILLCTGLPRTCSCSSSRGPEKFPPAGNQFYKDLMFACAFILLNKKFISSNMLNPYFLYYFRVTFLCYAQFHPVWGQIMKAGFQNSRFAHQVERFACLYTSQVGNLGLYSPNKYYRPVENFMVHESNVLSL